MHEKNQRRLCIAIFFALCVLPTVVTVSVALTQRLPGRVAATASKLSQQLGLEVHLQDVSYPRPGTTLLTGVELFDAETHQQIAHIRLLEFVQRGNRLAVVASQPEFQLAQLDRVWKMLAARLHDATSAEARQILQARELTLHHSGGAETLADVRCDIITQASGARLSLQCRLASSSSKTPLRLIAVRDRQAPAAVTRVEFEARDSPLPCSLLAERFSVLSKLGTQASFQGSFWSTQTDDNCRAELTGRFSGIELDELVSQNFPHKLSGLADAFIEKATIQDGRLLEAAGSLNAGPGVISRSLLTSVAQRMGLAATDVVHDTQRPLHQFRQLAFEFTVSDDGLVIVGQCDDGTDNSVIIADEGPLLGQPTYQPLPVVGLVRALVPDNEVQVPATRETDEILRRLPLPRIIISRDDQAQTPKSQLRFARGIPDSTTR